MDSESVYLNLSDDFSKCLDVTPELPDDTLNSSSFPVDETLSSPPQETTAASSETVTLTSLPPEVMAMLPPEVVASLPHDLLSLDGRRDSNSLLSSGSASIVSAIISETLLEAEMCDLSLLSEHGKYPLRID